MEEFLNQTVGELVNMVEEFGAGKMSVIPRTNNNEALYGVFIVMEPELVERIIQTIEEYDNEEGI